MRKELSSIKKGFTFLLVFGFIFTISSFNSQEHKLIGDMGFSRVVIPASVNLPADWRWNLVNSSQEYSVNWKVAKMLAVGFITNTPTSADLNNKLTSQDNCYSSTFFRQKPGNQNNFIEDVFPPKTIGIPASIGNQTFNYTFGDLVALYGDFRRTVYCPSGNCVLTDHNNADLTFEGKITNTYCPPPGQVNTNNYLNYIAFGLWPPYGIAGNALENQTVGDADYNKAAWWGDEMMRLANVNETHFSSVAVAWYIGMHRLALLYVNMARINPNYWYQALHYEASALHCLTDLFCLGHVVTSRDQSSYGTMKHDELTGENVKPFQWMENVIAMGGGVRDKGTGKISLTPNSPVITDKENVSNDFIRSYFKVFTKDTWAFWSKTEHSYHDTYNNGGAIVYNLRGNRFQIYGDASLHLLKDGKSRQVIEDAVTVSVQSLFNAYVSLEQNSGKINAVGKMGSPYFEALQYIPVFIEKLINDPNFNKWLPYVDYLETMSGKSSGISDKCRLTFLNGGNDNLNLAQKAKGTCSFFPYIRIGNQEWMRKNLDVTTYRDGTSIPEIKDQQTFYKTKTGAWCYYNFNSANGAVYGKLYNWYAVHDTLHGGLAPEGYHIPTKEEWAELSNSLGGESVAGAAIKTTTGWRGDGAINSNNSSGFSAVPAGTCFQGFFSSLGAATCWWTTTYSIANVNASVPGFYLQYGSADNGLSVRCIKD